jgi:hypothetical protein
MKLITVILFSENVFLNYTFMVNQIFKQYFVYIYYANNLKRVQQIFNFNSFL